MALSSNNLTDIGQGAGKTTNFWIRYENSLPDQTNVVNNANSLLSVVENEFAVTTGWFGTPSNQFGTSHRQEVRLDEADTDNGGGSFSFPGANNSGFGNPISLDSQNLMSDAPLPAQRVEMVFMAEWVEVLMGIRGNWNAGDSSGEGLSHWSAITRFQQGHDHYYGSFVANWLNGDGSPNQGTILPNPARGDWVNTTYTGSTVSDGTFVHGDGDPVSYGCALAFIYYLNVQLGFSINQIISSYNSNLASAYHTLTSDNSDPFAIFLGLVQSVYPPSVTASISGPNRNNPFPIARISFGAGKNTFGKDETQDIINTQGGYVPNAFTIFIEGFSKSSFQSLGITVGSFAGSFFGLTGVAITPNPVGVQFESGINDLTPQRIEIAYDLHLDNALLAHFPASGENQFDLSVSLNASATGEVSGSQASMQFELIAGADPYFTNLNADHSNLPYLSQDLRVFTVTPALNATPIPGVPALADNVSGAYAYIQNVLSRWNSSTNGFTNPNGPDPFTTILPDQGDANQGDSSVTPFTVQFTGSPFPTNITISNNYSFAIARVRLRGSAASQASNVRVFFRLWTTQTNDTDYDVNGAYLSDNDAAGKPGSPRMGAGNTTIPFFATNNFSGQTDYAGGPNIQTLTIPDHQDQLWAYFGCFLNLYDTGNVINGAQVQAYLNGTHHCIVAQIAFDDAPIPQSVSPLSWDQLAQRNLQVTRSDNPGPAAAHRIPQTFDTRPGRTIRPPHGPNTIYPDELMIEWGSVPTGSVASLYWPQVHASDVLALAKTFYGVSPLGMSDANTIRIPITRGVSYVPIPPGSGDNFAGLITIDLPLGVRSGQVFDVTVKRLGTRIGKPLPPPPPPPPRLQTAPGMIYPDGKAIQVRTAKGGSKQHRTPPTEVERLTQWRYVVGTFQIRIPVTTGDKILPTEETTLAILKWRLEQMSPSNRWHPVLVRYIKYLSDRVDGLGGNSAAVPPSLTFVPPLPLRPHEPERERCGKICEVLFDCHGEFTGFVLEDCCERHVFHSRARNVGNLAMKACRYGLTLCVWVDGKDGGKIRKLGVKA
ncbi:hypothetical protein JQ594_04015 [Bradyrhizobium manausense]|uniref:hypothetical protein n=1 Tax=Bradyrhizobium manausense TaxID=989370 RepID=UPI001BAC375C|nr:hypothetical protein [Bradyrhizobium manausense]MBR0685067.1 hypothetical protein [Bradyrhizobium manausense]